MNYECIKELTSIQLKKMEKEQCRKFLPDKTRIVTLDGKEIGFYAIFFICGRLTLEYYLFEAYQHKGMGAGFVQAVTDFVGQEYPEFSTIYLLIYHNNIGSLCVAQKNGYSTGCVDYEFSEIVSAESPEYYLYGKNNVYYKNDAKRLVKAKELYE